MLLSTRKSLSVCFPEVLLSVIIRSRKNIRHGTIYIVLSGFRKTKSNETITTYPWTIASAENVATPITGGAAAPQLIYGINLGLNRECSPHGTGIDIADI